MFQVNAIAEAYDEDYVYENLERSDLDFTTELEEPTAPEVLRLCPEVDRVCVMANTVLEDPPCTPLTC